MYQSIGQLYFLPDPMGDLVFNGVASNVLAEFIDGIVGSDSRQQVLMKYRPREGRGARIVLAACDFDVEFLKAGLTILTQAARRKRRKRRGRRSLPKPTEEAA